MISLMIWLPVIGAAILACIPESQQKVIRGIALLVALATFGLSLFLLSGFDSSAAGFQMHRYRAWLPTLGVSYSLGMDGISIWLVVLASFISLVAVAYSNYVKDRLKLYMSLILLLETAMLGSFASLDLILFYSFFELSLVPMFFLISVWGGQRRKYAAAKFFIYTFAGSIFMLVGMVSIAYLNFKATGVWTFSIVDIQSTVAQGALWTGAVQLESLIFWAFAVAFLIKAPSFPFHTWIADTYAEAPVVGPIMSSVMVKMGTYGILRFCLPLFPDVIQRQIPILMTLAVIGILYGAVLAAVQKDMRRLLAYSSVSHVGFILLGIFSLNSIGLVGGSYQQISHAITATALFVLVGFLIERRGSAMFADYGGLKARMPMFAALFLISMLASVGLPGLNGFVGEFLSMLGAFESGYGNIYGLTPAFVAFAGFGVVLTAGYLLYMFQQIFYGPVRGQLNARLKDLKSWEVGLVSVLVGVMIVGGLAPTLFTRQTEASLGVALDMATKGANERPMWSTLSNISVPSVSARGGGSGGGAKRPGNAGLGSLPTANPNFIGGQR